MINLGPKDLLSLSSKEIDKILGLAPSLEVAIEDEEAYGDGHTGAEALYTSYPDLLLIYEDLKRRGLKSFADLGAGNCRSKILFDLLRSPFKSAAYEFAPERIEGAKDCYRKLQLSDEENFFARDLRGCDLSQHDAFFIYLPVGNTLHHILEELKRISRKKERYLYVIESHGDLIPYLKDHLPHLCLLEKKSLKGERHDPHLWIFKLEDSSAQLKRQSELKELAHQNKISHGGFSLENLKSWEKWFLFSLFQQDQEAQFLVEEDEYIWLASVESWVYGISDDTIETHYPYRIHRLHQIRALCWTQDQLKEFVAKRRETFRPPLSSLRKIIVAPRPCLEYAGGHLEEFQYQFKLDFPQIASP